MEQKCTTVAFLSLIPTKKNVRGSDEDPHSRLGGFGIGTLVVSTYAYGPCRKNSQITTTKTCGQYTFGVHTREARRERFLRGTQQHTHYTDPIHDGQDDNTRYIRLNINPSQAQVHVVGSPSQPVQYCRPVLGGKLLGVRVGYMLV